MPSSVAVAILRGDPPMVFVADDLPTLNWVLALRLIGRLTPSEIEPRVRSQLRQALLDERWGDAVALWIEHVDHDGIDVYESHPFHAAEDVESAVHEMQFLPLFADG